MISYIKIIFGYSTFPAQLLSSSLTNVNRVIGVIEILDYCYSLHNEKKWTRWRQLYSQCYKLLEFYKIQNKFQYNNDKKGFNNSWLFREK